MLVQFEHSDWAWSTFQKKVYEIIELYSPRNVIEIGARQEPTVDLRTIKKYNLEYYVLDVSEEELEKVPNGYNKINADACHFESNLKYDFIFSAMLAEHIPDGETFHKNIFYLLSDGGVAFHFFPTLYALPFVVNVLLPENLTQKLLRLLQPHRPLSTKFPAYYSWCRGPTKSQIARFSRLGYEILEYIGFFGHKQYYEDISILHKIHEYITRLAINVRNPHFTSYAQILLRKPRI